jgi:bifunctional N-acetylglucosamine-1-phosphate-uridyltransferase/glucosamine-1-phosphate-acetyltransferase GlmU-like protein
MDAVILAAGRGTRLSGHATPFFKPMLQVNGKPLVLHAAEYANVMGAEKIVVVVSPANREAMENIFRNFSFVTLVDQDEPLGPGHALLIGLTKVTSGRAAVLMSDNIMLHESLELLAPLVRHDVVGTMDVEPELASRFTRVVQKKAGPTEFREGTPVQPDEINSEGMVKVWCGPLVFQTNLMRAALVKDLENATIEHELKIGPYLGAAMNRPILFNIKSMDVGMPDSFMEVR